VRSSPVIVCKQKGFGPWNATTCKNESNSQKGEHKMSVRFKTVEFTPVMSVAANYATGDQVGLVNTLTDALDNGAATVKLMSIVVRDKGAQKKAGEIWFFKKSPTLTNIDSGAFGFADSQLDNVIGVVAIPAANYFDAADGAATSSVAVVSNINLMVKGAPGDFSGANTKNLYAVFVTRDTPTYASLGLTVVCGFEEAA
jgi:hypothetical protein